MAYRMWEVAERAQTGRFMEEKDFVKQMMKKYQRSS